MLSILLFSIIYAFFLQIFKFRFERYERALVKGHKQSLDQTEFKENIDTDAHKNKAQVMKLMHEGHKLR